VLYRCTVLWQGITFSENKFCLNSCPFFSCIQTL
jgi:hypothetical protein